MTLLGWMSGMGRKIEMVGCCGWEKRDGIRRAGAKSRAFSTTVGYSVELLHFIFNGKIRVKILYTFPVEQ